MKLKWYGHSCFGMTFENGTTLITDPFDDTVGYPLCTARADAVLSSHDHFDHNHIQSVSGNPKLINTPGAHEINGVRINGYMALLKELDKCKAGDRVELEIYRYYDAEGNLTGDYEQLFFTVRLEMLK